MTATRGLSRSRNFSRIEENHELIDLYENECAVIEAYSNDLAKKGELRRYVYPPFGIELGFPDVPNYR